MKLQLKHISPYLPYGLNIINGVNRKIELTMQDVPYHFIKGFKPILRPLSDLSNVNGFSLSDMFSYGAHNDFWLKENFEVKYLMHLDFEKLVSFHFDVFGLIDKELAIDINTLKQ